MWTIIEECLLPASSWTLYFEGTCLPFHNRIIFLYYWDIFHISPYIKTVYAFLGTLFFLLQTENNVVTGTPYHLGILSRSSKYLSWIYPYWQLIVSKIFIKYDKDEHCQNLGILKHLMNYEKMSDSSFETCNKLYIFT